MELVGACRTQEDRSRNLVFGLWIDDVAEAACGKGEYCELDLHQGFRRDQAMIAGTEISESRVQTRRQRAFTPLIEGIPASSRVASQRASRPSAAAVRATFHWCREKF